MPNNIGTDSNTISNRDCTRKTGLIEYQLIDNIVDK
jgi:hypothetical protein